METRNLRLVTIPNAITLANMACGAAALVVTLRGSDLTTAFWLVAAAAVFDFLDGLAARLLRAQSEVGRQLDSLCDVVSFGVAPSAMLYVMFTGSGGDTTLAWGVFAVALCSALRLARFNVDPDQSHSFRGLPTPACALLVASSAWLYDAGRLVIAQPLWIVAAAAVLAFLLVSPVRMFALKFSDYSFRGNALRYVFLAGSAAALALLGIAAVPWIVVAYIVSSLAACAVCKKR